MDYLGVGFSNIRIPNDSNSYIYRYDSSVNIFPEEVFIHEFLHTLERNLMECGYEIAELHAYQDFGYKEEKRIGQYNWYQAYMRNEIKSEGKKVGLDSIVYTIKPAKKSNFEYYYELNNLKEPQNIIEEIQGMFRKITNVFKKD